MAVLMFFAAAAVLAPLGWFLGVGFGASIYSSYSGGNWGGVWGVILALLTAGFLAKALYFANDAPASGWARQAVGLFYRFLVVAPLVGGTVWLIAPLFLDPDGPLHDYRHFGFLAVLAVGIPVWLYVVPVVKFVIGRCLKPLLDVVRVSQFGQGGSAAFGGVVYEWAARYRPGSILLGTSLFDRTWKVGHADDRGFLTIASSRSGKGRSAIIPNLILWPGSALVIDPKGTNAAVTAQRRAGMGQAVYVVDPFGITPFEDDKRAGFNPLDMIDLDSNQVTEDIRQIADALIVSDGGRDSHWNEAGQTILAGVIAHLLASGKGRTLNDVRRVMSQGNAALDELFADMLEDRSAGGLPVAAASLVTNAGPNERGSFYTTVSRNLAWLDSVAMQQTLSKTDFDIGDLKRKPMTVYVVLPPEMLAQHARFLRLFVNGAINAISQGAAGKHKVLFLLDEFYALGNMAVIESAAGLLAGYGMKLWPIVQNLTQLQQLYPQNWETFFANAGAVQVFSVNDRATAEYLVARLGSRVMSVKQGQQILRTVAALREAEEIGRDVARERLRQIIYRNGNDPLVLRRMLYDQDFPASMFAPDPDYAGAPKRPLYDRLKPALSWLKGAVSDWSLPKINFGQVLAVAGPPAASMEMPAMSEDERNRRLSETLDRAAPFVDRWRAKPVLPDFMRGPYPAPEPPQDHSGLSFDELLRAPVAASKHAIFERYQALQDAAAGDEEKLSRAALWLTGDYRANLTGPDPFAVEEGRQELPKWKPGGVKGNPWAGRKRGDER